MAVVASERLLNRELSWLDFNARVLALADDDRVPLLERVKFAAIFSSNLDEFFQVRVSALKDQVAASITQPSPDGRSPAQQLVEISDRVEELVREQEGVLLDRLVPTLREAGVELLSWSDLDETDRKHLEGVFEQRIFPVLTPLAFDPSHPFPYISNLSLNLGVYVLDAATGERRFARVKVPPLLPRFLPLPDGDRFVPLEEVIEHQLSILFPGMQIAEHYAFRVTRNADLTLAEGEADDLLAQVEMELRRRRFGRAVRLEAQHDMSAEMLELLLRELDLERDDVSFHRAPLDLKGLFLVHATDRPDLKDDPWPPVSDARLAAAKEEERDIFSVIREGDVLVHHPYESFASSVEEFVRQAADDPRVLTIKMTLYRTSGDSPIVRSLIRAAERGVQVAALVELKARFDEEANINWAKALERAGVHVVYGLVGLKTHSKTLLVIRSEADGIRRYVHIGTGNYNPSTARLYEDFGLLSCDAELGSDLTQLFNHLTGYSREDRYRKILVAPHYLRHRIHDLIAQEMSYGERGRIVFKLNSLIDTAMIDSLYAASQAGVQIDLILRGICGLRPGVAGLSETIRVRSILGRYLEHSRIYSFGNGAGAGETAYYIGSADLMPRNLDKRVEACASVERPELQRRIQEVLDVCLDPEAQCWELQADGTWERRNPDGGVETQRRLYELNQARERAVPLPVGDTAKNLEREVKLGAWPGFELPDLDDLADWVAVAEPGFHRLDATYHDAPDLRLIRAGVTLRHRLGEGGDAGRWTLKLPGAATAGQAASGAMARNEITVDAPAAEVPAELGSAVAGLLRRAPLRPVARLQTDRRVLVLRDGGGREVGEVSDDEVTVLDGERVAARFRELEVELRPGAPERLLDLVVARLRAAGAGAPDPTPKLVRALGPRALTPPDPPTVTLSRKPKMAEVVQQAFSAAVQRLLTHDPVARLDLDPSGVHQARVSTRRLRSDLRTFEVVLDVAWAEDLRSELKWLADALGSVRDVDVLGIRLRRELEGLDPADAVEGERLLAHLQTQRQERLDRLERTMNSERYLVLLDRLVDAAERPALTADAERPAADVLTELVAQPWHKLRKAAKDLGPNATVEQLHALRIKAKRARYASEAAARVIPKAVPFAEAVSALQDELGELHDAVVAEAWLRDTVVAGLSGRQSLVAGLLIGQQRDEVEARRRAWRGVWKELDKPKLRAWMGRHG